VRDVAVVVAALACLSASDAGRAAARCETGRSGSIDPWPLADEIDQFLAREVTAHFAAIETLDPPPARVLGAGTTGDFSWGTFMRALAAYADHALLSTVSGRDVAAWIGRMGLIEARAGSKAFSQLYAALALRHFGERLEDNAVWQRLTPGERDEWRALLDVRRFYDPTGHRVIDLPENYLGVAARTAAIGYRMGIATDRMPLDALLTDAARQFTGGRVYADDAPPTGRYDRYSNEYARYVWDAAALADRRDILQALRPTLTAQMRLWWDVVGEDGYGYPWGRTLGVVSYLDTLEICAFLAEHPEFRPAPLADLVSLYARAWSWLRHDYRDDRHLLSVFEFGRGNFSYITRDREWQQTTGFLGKAQVAHAALERVLERERVAAVPPVPRLGAVARFEFFRNGTDRVDGVWVVRQGPMRFALPITGATRPGVADYLPAPHGLPGFAAPVEQDVPALVPYLDLQDGRTIVAADGADEIHPSPDGRELRAVWRRWARVSGNAGELVDPGLTSEVRWTIREGLLGRTETLTARLPIAIRAWRMIVPTTAATSEAMAGGVLLSGAEGRLGVTIATPWRIESHVRAMGNDPAGRGARGPIPLHVAYEGRDVHVVPGTPLTWQLTLRVESP
jgi:hypothetical protein